MKTILKFIFVIMIFLSFSVRISALEKIVITGYDVRFRTSPTTGNGSSIITSLNPGTELSLLDKNAGTGNGCSSVWYKAQYGSSIGYVCSQFVKLEEVEIINPEDYKEYSEYLTKLGFPDSYIPKLIELHNKYPNWQFEIMNVDLDFNELIRLEYDGYSKGWSLLEDTGRYYDGLKSFDSWSYNYLTNVFSTNFTGGGSVWYAASKNSTFFC